MDINKVSRHIYNSAKRAKYDKMQGLQQWHDTVLKSSVGEKYIDVFEKVANEAKKDNETDICKIVLDYIRRVNNGS